MSPAPTTTLLKAASDDTRFRILQVLDATPGKELCVCELVDVLREPQYNVSRHLRVLTHAGLVEERPEGRWVYYRLVTGPRENRALLRFLREVAKGLGPAAESRLERRLALRQGGACVVGPLDRTLLSRRQSPAA